jgi:hypothetical protein
MAWQDHKEFLIWRCPSCLARGWSVLHVPSSHWSGTEPRYACCQIPETLTVKPKP